MMSRKSRRKTLSHAEIENFLCDLGSDDDMETMKNRVMDVTTPASDAFVFADSENKVQVSSTMIDQKDENGRKYRANVVRAFHKDLLLSREAGTNSPALTFYAKIVHDETEYPLLPTRQIHPENFQFPVSSLESKKALLMSMQPMLSAAEKQRKMDSDLLEDFTRCKVGKSRARSSTYEYLDFDTNLRISGQEYSRRYLLYLAKKKAAHVDLTTCSPPQLQPQQQPQQSSRSQAVLQDISRNFLNTAPPSSTWPEKKEKQRAMDQAAPMVSSTSTDMDFLMSFDDDKLEEEEAGRECRSKIRGGGRSGSSSRRRTLSPASTKAILLQEMEDASLLEGKEENEEEEEEEDELESSTDTAVHMDTAADHDARSVDVDVDAETSILVACVGDAGAATAEAAGGRKRSFQVGVEVVTESPLKVQVKEQSTPSFSSSESCSGQLLHLFDDAAGVPPIPAPASSEQQLDQRGAGQSPPPQEEDNLQAAQQDVEEMSHHQECISSEEQHQHQYEHEHVQDEDEDEDDVEEARARERYELRLEVARWKYCWEQAGAHAARVARTGRRRV